MSSVPSIPSMPSLFESVNWIYIVCIVLIVVLFSGIYYYYRKTGKSPMTAATTPHLMFFHQTTCKSSKMAMDVMREIEKTKLATVEYVNCDTMTPPPPSVLKYNVENVPFIINISPDTIHLPRKFNQEHITAESVRQFIGMGLDEIPSQVVAAAAPEVVKPQSDSPPKTKFGDDEGGDTSKIPALNLDMQNDDA